MNAARLFQQFLTVRGVSTDTRKIQDGDIFFALKGENFNGNAYAAMALEKGASLVVVDDPQYFIEGDERYLMVDDALLSLQQLANQYRKTFTIPFLGITGSNGKTTTKELIYSIISQEKKVFATQGNLNNHIGVPLTLLSLTEDLDIAIIEMGANRPGDIKELVEIAEPTHGMITNIGQAHLERFGSLEGVQKTKGEMFDFIREHEGKALVNQKDLKVKATAEGIADQTTFGTLESDFWIEQKDLRADGITVWVGSRNWQESLRLDSVLLGEYSADNVLAATAAAFVLGISPVGIQKGVQSYQPTMNRTQMLQKGGFRFLMDAYNANPSSMKAAISGLFSQNYGKVGLALGAMFELGEQSEELHKDLGHFLNDFPVARLLLFGEEMRPLLEVCKDLQPQWFATAGEAEQSFAQEIEGLDLVLIKGSRGMALEQLLKFVPDQG